MEPQEKQGFATKHSRSSTGLFGNWKQRFFVLSYGKIVYYTSPMKDQKKGSMSLKGATIVTQKARGPTEIYIQAESIVEHNLYLKFKTEELCLEWTDAIKAHIRYYFEESRRTVSTGNDFNFNTLSVSQDDHSVVSSSSHVGNSSNVLKMKDLDYHMVPEQDWVGYRQTIMKSIANGFVTAYSENNKDALKFCCSEGKSK